MVAKKFRKYFLLFVLFSSSKFPFRNYVVEKRDKKSGEWVRCNDAVNGTTVTIPKLKEGHEYEFRVMAENINGLSEPLLTEKAILVKNPFSKIQFEFR